MVDCLRSLRCGAAVRLAAGAGANAGERVRAVYYGSAVREVDTAMLACIKAHGIGRMYVRYFDVVQGDGGRPVPNATLRFRTGVPGGLDVVPVVYIVNECMAGDTTGLALNVLRRVMQMSETNGIEGVHEVQIDCDWTRRTRRRYLGFVRTLVRLAQAEGVDVSATIRLHQLSDAPPPVSRGVLMMYNTGAFTDLRCEKPILDMADAAPYLRHLASYGLPLAAAYPIYSWQILFRGGKYVGIMHRDDDLPVLPGDTIVTRTPAVDDIMEAARAVTARRRDANREVILFDLSNRNITRYTPDDYEEIYNSSDI